MLHVVVWWDVYLYISVCNRILQLNLCTVTNLALVLSLLNVAKFKSDQLMGGLMHAVVQKISVIEVKPN